MRMLVCANWDEHYLDTWPEKIDVGFGITAPRPSHFWDDHFIGEVLQGSLGYSDPLRDQPWSAYQANGIQCYDDDLLFSQSEPSVPLFLHDPGVHKPNSDEFDEVIAQAKARNMAVGAVARQQQQQAQAQEK